MKKTCVLTLALLLSLPGCKDKKKTVKPRKKAKMEQQIDVFSSVNMSLAEENESDVDEYDVNEDARVLSFFDEEIEEFSAMDDDYNISVAVEEGNSASSQVNDQEEFSWVDAQDEGEFKNIYFTFNHYGVHEDQKLSLETDIAQIKELLAEAKHSNAQPTVVIEGHSCHSAGAPSYNLALSEKRAKYIADRLVEAGIPQSNIKVVGRGQEVPAVIEGEVITGSREDQWPNRRVEVRVIYT